MSKFNTEEAEKNGGKDGKVLYKLMNNDVYGKTMENQRNRIYVRLVSNKKSLLKIESKNKLYATKISDNDLIAIRKSQVPFKA